MGEVGLCSKLPLGMPMKFVFSVLSGLASLFRKPKILEKAPEITVLPAKKRVLHTIDLDQKGMFVHLVHATSSAYLEAILRSGLQPITDIRRAVTEYLASLVPDLDLQEIASLLTFDRPETRGYENAALVYVRLENEDHGSKLFTLPLHGSRGYLESAARNASVDGGEVFRAARHVLERHLGRKLQPRFPDAHPIVVIAKCYLEEDARGTLQLTGVEGIQRICIRSDLPNPFVGENMEVRLNGNYPPSSVFRGVAIRR